MYRHLLITAILCAGLLSCRSPKKEIAGEKTLKEAFADKFLVGVAVTTDQVYGIDSVGAELVNRHFNAIVAEDDMKSENIHPHENEYYWDDADRFVEFGEENGMAVIGHCLIWHSQCAPWFCVDENCNLVDKQTLRDRMKEHIHTIVGRYKGRVKGWDVVNEAILDDGSYRPSQFYQILGEEYIPLAFQYAHEADPDAELYINDYGMNNAGRRGAYVKIANDLRKAGIRIDAIGMQCHMGIDYPDFKDLEESIKAFAATGCKVMITEMDMSTLPTLVQGANISDRATMENGMNPYAEALPDSVSALWNKRMSEVFDILMRHSDVITRINAWGLTDGHSWKNDWPVEGRTDYPLLFDRNYQLKPFLKEYTAPRQALFAGFDYKPLAIEGIPSTDSVANPLIPGCHPDPSIVRVENDYYLVNSSFSYFPGVPIWHSRDLRTWERIGNVLDRPSQLSLPGGIGISKGIYAPDISYNPANETFYMITTLVGNGGTFYVTCKDPKKGNWSDPVWLPEVGGIDPSILFDEDGKAYIVNNDAPEVTPRYEGHRAIWAREFDWQNDRVAGPQKCILDGGVRPEENPIWIEGPHLYHIDDKYFLMCAEGGTGPDHREVILTSDSPMGKFTPCAINPILKAPSADSWPVTCSGHADLVCTPEGEWHAVFLAVRPYSGGHDICGRETFIMPVEWQNGQPVVPGALEPIPYGIDETRSISLWNDSSITPEALFIRVPDYRRFNIADGKLAITAGHSTLFDARSPAAIGCWATENAFSASTSLDEFECTRPEDFAGLVLFQDDDTHIIFGKSADENGKPCIRLAAVSKKKPVIQSTFALENSNKSLSLQVKTLGDGIYRFAYGHKDEMTEIPDTVSADILSTQTAGNFTGTMVGLYATSDYK